MLETLSICLVAGGIYVLLLLLIVEGWLLVWHYFLCRIDLVQELLEDELLARQSGACDATKCAVTSVNTSRRLFDEKDRVDATSWFVEPSHRRIRLFRAREA
ncbi:hypothetical protein MRX96_023542 [Rhipicephalus microplus]